MCLMPKSGRFLRPKKRPFFAVLGPQNSLFWGPEKCGPRTAKSALFSGPPFLRSWDRIFHFFENVIFVVQGPQNRYFLVFFILWSLDRNFNFLFFVKKYYFCYSLAYFLYYIYKQKQKVQIYSNYRFCGPDFTKYTNM